MRRTYVCLLLVAIFSVSACLRYSAYASASLTVVSHASFVGGDGYYHIIGEVANAGEEPLGAVEVTAELYDIDGNLIDLQVGQTLIDVLAPQQKSPFDIIADEALSEDIDSYELSASYQVCGPEFEFKLCRPEFEFSFADVQTGWDDQGRFVVEGQVVNNGTKQVEETHVVGTFYSDQGNVIGVGYTTPNPTALAPGQAGIFRIVIEQTIGSVSDYTLQAESRDYLEIPEFSLPSVILALVTATVLTLCSASHHISKLQQRSEKLGHYRQAMPSLAIILPYLCRPIANGAIQWLP